ncbi:ubiquitin-like domain-containing protein [Streptomyces sp. NPDC048604]|uniref:ubiquitin-like domain-containing protein n=1 Tax=Streptomyces sp. NPDC048604 TaxID=3365578 RepID=UPI00371D441F
MSTSQGSHRAGRGGRRAAAGTVEPPSVPPPATPSIHEYETQPYGFQVAPPVPPAAGGRASARRAARRRRAAPVGEGLRRLVPQALVVAFLAGGTTAFVADDKAVRLSVDGVPRTLHTFADDVEELLADEGLATGAHDLVAPGRGAELADGDEVVVRYGRPVRLTLDGQRRQVWTTARTVEGALRQLGVRAEGAYLSVSRSAPIGRAGLALDVRTERTVTLLADGRERTVRTNAATVREVVEEAGITLSGQDTTSVPPGSFPRDGQTVAVLRITGSREVREETVPYAVERVRDPELFAGTEVVDRQGVQGVRRVTYALRTVNGVRQKPRRISEELVRAPVAQRVKVGTKPLPGSVGGADGLNWGALAQCESGGRPQAVDPSGTYGGLYQFDPGTWRSLGGSGVAQEAPAAEQTYRAKKLYVQRGASPWPHCGRRLYR